MKKVVINRCFGGFSISQEAVNRLAKLKGVLPEDIDSYDLERDDPLLVQVVEELKEKANGSCAYLNIVEIPDEVEFIIEEYDGSEHVAEKHRTWR
jgi:hypothetical protein